MCFSRCSFLIKGCNWCYLRPGTELYGRGTRSQTEMVSGRGDRKPLCNLVRLEIWAAIKPTGLNSTCLLLHCSFRASALNCCELLLSLLFPQEPGFHLGVYMLEYFQLCIQGEHSVMVLISVFNEYLKGYVVSLCQKKG